MCSHPANPEAVVQLCHLSEPNHSRDGNSFCSLSQRADDEWLLQGKRSSCVVNLSICSICFFYFKQLQWSAWHPTSSTCEFHKRKHFCKWKHDIGRANLSQTEHCNFCRQLQKFTVILYLPSRKDNHSSILWLLQGLLCSHSWFQDDGVLYLSSSCLAPLCNTTCKMAGEVICKQNIFIRICNSNIQKP